MGFSAVSSCHSSSSSTSALLSPPVTRGRITQKDRKSSIRADLPTRALSQYRPHNLSPLVGDLFCSLGALCFSLSTKGLEALMRAKHLQPGKAIYLGQKGLVRDQALYVAVISARFLLCLAGVALAFAGSVFIIPGLMIHLSLNRSRSIVTYIEHPKAQELKKVCGEGEDFSIVSANTGLMHPVISTLNHLRAPKERAREIIEDLINPQEGETSPDVFCGQEVFSEDNTREMVEGLQEHYPYMLCDVIPQSMGIDSGLFFASKFPIRGVKVFHYPNGKGEDAFANKGFIAVLLETAPREYVIVGNTHMQAKYGEKYKQVRTEQLQMLHRGVHAYKEELQREGLHIEGVILSGDMNIADYSEFGEHIKEKQKNEPIFSLYEEANRDVTSTLYQVHEPPNPQESGYGQRNWEDRLIKETKVDYILLDKTRDEACGGLSYVSLHPYKSRKRLFSASSDHAFLKGAFKRSGATPLTDLSAQKEGG